MGLRLAGVSKSFGGIQAVEQVSFEVTNNSITGLIGPNGSGKTTIFNLITGFYKLDKGVIRYKGERIDRLRPHERVKRGVMRTFQITRVFPQLTVSENMMIPTRENGLASLFRSALDTEGQERAARLLKNLGLLRLKDEKAGNLSFGQQKLLEFAMSFMIDAELILLDEPSAGINPTLMNNLKDWIRREQEKGKVFLIIEHNMNLIMDLCEKIIVLHHGQKLAEGSPEEIQGNEEVLEAYLGN